MKKRKLGTTDLYVTPVAFGVLTMGGSQMDLPLQEGAELIRYAIDQGINFFDTAQYYETYPYLREALKGMDRAPENPDFPAICTKMSGVFYEEMEDAIEEALEEMDLETIDIFLLHEVRQDPDWDMRTGAWQCLQDYKAKGVIRAIGVSTHHVDITAKMAQIPECDAGLPADQLCQPGHSQRRRTRHLRRDGKAAIQACHNAGKGVFAMKAFGGGNLTADYVKALDYVTGLPGVDSTMVGIGKKEEIDRLVAYAEGTLPRDYVPDISHKRIHIDAGDCEGCGACIKRCPNKAIHWNQYGLAAVDDNICLTCGYCAPVCPVRAIILF